MSKKKKKQLVLLNGIIVIVNIALFSNAFLGLSLSSGEPLSVGLAWSAVIVSAFVFYRGNSRILTLKETRHLITGIRTLDDCIPVFQEAVHKGDVFDENIYKSIEQIKRFKRKHGTIHDMLLHKFSLGEMSYQKFSGVLQNVQEVLLASMRSILNKISAFDIEEYEAMQKKGYPGGISQEKIGIFNEYINFINGAVQSNEDILLKLDKMLLEISRYNSLEGGDVQKLPAMVEMDELIKNASMYK
ncbi:MAG: hypothetical protein FWF47_04495 [Clostridia bacterium]|nr:hypothetical protein [Clostridia bacterium]